MSMEFTKRDLALIADLINIAWQAGAIRGPQQAQEIEFLRMKLAEKEKPPCPTDTKP